MTATKLDRIQVEKPWGVDRLPAPFASLGGKRIGEIWFPAPKGDFMPLLVKYLFTSEKLSIQVHPNDYQAKERGLSSGKEECWYILAAEPGAVLGMGTERPLSQAELRKAALSGEIEQLMTWHSVEPGMLFHIPPGTVHAIGAGVSLIEVQQNIDVTYRLYDYGRPRELHLDDGVAVSDARPFPVTQVQYVERGAHRILLRTDHFVLAQIKGSDRTPINEANGTLTVIPIDSDVVVAGTKLSPGDCALAPAGTAIEMDEGALCLIAWPKGASV